MRRAVPAAVLVLMLAISASLFAAIPEDLLQSVPDDAVVVVTVDSLKALEDSILPFVEAIQPGMAAGIRAQIRGRLNVDEEGSAIDLDAPWVMALVPGREEGDSSFITLVPISDYDAWRAARATSISADEQGAEYLEEMGGRVYFTRLGNRVLFSSDAAGLRYADLRAAAAQPLADERIDFLNTYDDGVITINASMSALRRRYPDLRRRITEGLRGLGAARGGMGGNEVSMAVTAGYLADAAEAMDELLLSINASGEGLRLGMVVEPTEGEFLSDVFSQLGQVDLDPISRLPRDAIAFNAMTLDSEAAWDWFGRITADSIRVLQEMSPPAEGEGLTEAEIQSLPEKLHAMREAGIGNNVVVARLRAPEPPYLRMAGIYDVDDEDKAVAAIRDIVTEFGGDLTSIKMMVPGARAAQVTASTETLDGAELQVITFDFDYTGLPADQVQMARGMFGEEMVMRILPADGRLYIAVNTEPSVLQTLASTPENGMDMDKVNRTMELLGSDLSFVALVSLPDVVVNTMAAMAPSPEAFKAVQVPQTDMFVGVGGRFGDERAIINAVIPVQQINATKGAIMQLMMHSMGQMGHPAGATQ